MDETTRKWFSTWVRFSFRDIADRDYLAARLLYKNRLFQASAWSSLQAIEKYLKGILLFSYQSIKRYKHDLLKLWQSTERLQFLNANLPTDCVEFLEDLSSQGANRYLDYTLYFKGQELLKLDRCVWHIRRYCQDFLLLPGDYNRYPGQSLKRIAEIPQEASPELAKTFRIPDGYLESLLDNTQKPLHSILVWKNFYYGKYKKHHIRFADNISWERPIHMMRPELIKVIERVAYIPKEILEEFSQYQDVKTNEEAA